MSAAERAPMIGGGQQDLMPGAEQRTSKSVTALANVKVDAERQKNGLPELLKEARLANPEVWDKAMSVLDRDPEAGARLIDELSDKSRATTVEENALLLQRKIAVRNEHARSMHEYLNAAQELQTKRRSGMAETPEDTAKINGLEARERFLFEQVDRIDKVTRSTGTEWGRAGQFRKQLAAEDFSLAGMLQMAQAAKGRPLTAEERIEIADLQRRIGELQKRLDEAEKSGKAKPGAGSDEGFALSQAQKEFALRLRADRDARAPWTVRAAREALDVINIPRTLMTAIDFPLLRQGQLAVLSHPVLAGKAVPEMIRSFFSEDVAARAQYEILHRPNAALYHAAGLSITSSEGPLANREEGFLSRLVGKIPVAGPLARASERSYQTVMNRLRADVFDHLADKLGREGKLTGVEAKAIANYVNVMTGRGPLGPAEKAANLLSQVFFSPRWAVSRFQMLTGQPLWSNFADSAPRARLAIATEYGRIAAGFGAAVGLALLAGFKLQKDPRSSDFGKMQTGNTRMDLSGGLAGTATFLARLTAGSRLNQSGQAVPVRGAVPYGQSTASDLIWNFTRGKLAPAPGAAVNLLAGSNVVGQPVTLGSQAKEMVTPLFVNDVYEAIKSEGAPKGSALSILGLLGMSMQTYEKQARRASAR